MDKMDVNVTPHTLTPNDEAHIRFLKEAYRQSQGSPDPSTKVGTVIVDQGANESSSIREAIAWGRNEFPPGLQVTDERLNHRPTKYMYIVHAETNALADLLVRMSRGRVRADLQQAAMYVYGLFPCTGCLKQIIPTGIRTVYYYNRTANADQNARWNATEESAATLSLECGIRLVSLNHFAPVLIAPELG